MANEIGPLTDHNMPTKESKVTTLDNKPSDKDSDPEVRYFRSSAIR